jgi:formate/nitrite transporter FocA (FNT family)
VIEHAPIMASLADSRAPGNVWAAWISVIAMNALGPLFAVIATAISGDHSAPADQSAGVDPTSSTRAQGANVSAAA